MIQRIQSVYLLFITAVMTFLLIRPYAEIGLTDGGSIVFYILSIERFVPNQGFLLFDRTPLLLILTILVGAISFFNIFVYARRLVQIRVCYINSIVLVVLLLLMYINYTQVKNAMEVVKHTFRLASLFPIAAIIANYMAIRSIRRDELLVQSYERMR